MPWRRRLPQRDAKGSLRLRLRLPTPTASVVRELYAVALAEGFRGQDIVALLAMYQGWAKAAGGSQT